MFDQYLKFKVIIYNAGYSLWYILWLLGYSLFRVYDTRIVK